MSSSVNSSGRSRAAGSPYHWASQPMLGGTMSRPAYPRVAMAVVARCGLMSGREPARLSRTGMTGAMPMPARA